MQGRGRKFDGVFILIIALCTILGFFTLFSEGDLFQYAKKVIFILTPWLFLAVLGRGSTRELFRALRWAFLLLCVVNIVAVIIMIPQGSFRTQYNDTWLFGQRTYMRNILLPAILFSTVWDRMSGKKLSGTTVFLLISSPAVLLIVDSMTSLCVVLVLEAFVLASALGLKRLDILKPFVLVAAVLNLLLVFLQKIEIFGTLITQVFNRNLTLSYRTDVWNIALDSIEANPWVGAGVSSLEETSFVVGFGKQLSNAHNEILDIWFKGGLVSLVLLFMLMFKCCKPLLDHKEKWYSFLVGLVLGCFFIEAVVGDIWYPQFFLVLFLAAYIDKWGPEIMSISRKNAPAAKSDRARNIS